MHITDALITEPTDIIEILQFAHGSPADPVYRTVLAFNESVTAAVVKYTTTSLTNVLQLWRRGILREARGDTAPLKDEQIEDFVHTHKWIRAIQYLWRSGPYGAHQINYLEAKAAKMAFEWVTKTCPAHWATQRPLLD